MTRIAFLLVLAGAAVAGGCSGVTTVNELPGTVRVKFGEEFRIADPDLTVRFAEILQDSRCAVDVVCIQEGSVTIRFSLFEPNGDVNTLIVETGQPAGTSAGILLRLIQVEPAPHSGTTISPQDYRATVEVSRAP